MVVLSEVETRFCIETNIARLIEPKGTIDFYDSTEKPQERQSSGAAFLVSIVATAPDSGRFKERHFIFESAKMRLGKGCE
jgi:hypothetical protein